MTWLPTTSQEARSACGVYAIRGCYHNGSYVFRARVIATDALIASSHDRGYVEGVVERHARASKAKAQAEVA